MSINRITAVLAVAGITSLHIFAADIKYIAHRGVPMERVENTISSLQVAAEQEKTWAVEMDVKKCATGELVIFHDDTTGRLALQDRKIEEMTLAELQEVELRYKEGDLYYNTVTKDLVGHIPTLEEVLDMLTRFGDRRPNVVLDIKSDGIADQVADVIARFCSESGWRAEQFWCIGPKYDELRRIHQNDPEVKIVPLIHEEAVAKDGQTLSGVLDELQAFGACGVLLIERTAAAAEPIKARDMQVWMGFVDETRDVVAAHAFSCVDGMILNTVDHLLSEYATSDM